MWAKYDYSFDVCVSLNIDFNFKIVCHVSFFFFSFCFKLTSETQYWLSSKKEDTYEFI